MRFTIFTLIIVTVCFLNGAAFADMKPAKSFDERKPTPYNGNQL